jgi:hypothetical protein
MKWIVREGESRRRMRVMGLAKDSVPEKTSGMHRCIPDRSKPNLKRLTSSSLLSFSLPSYSPLGSFSFSPAVLAKRVFSLMYKDYAHSCQEESE